ncbi:MAG: hypothetical protein KA803_15370 [Rhodoferax sp.]|nr:hypothetical protein [Rhodoferax sp.]
MSNPVTSAPKYRDFGSDRKLAKALIDGFPHVAWGCQAPALAAKIGALNKGDATWWRTRPEPTQTLANLLEITVEDLGVLASSASFIVSFSDFPALKPLDLKREASWRLGQEVLDASQAKNEYGRETLEEWLEPNPASWRPPSGLAWLHVDSPIEQQLLTQKLLAAGRFDVLVVPTLADAEEQLRGGKPLIVSVSLSSGEADLYAMADRPDSAGLLVIAPFTFPREAEKPEAASFYSWERIALRGRERRKFELTHSGMFSGDVKRWTWSLSPDWRLKLTAWVGARLDRHHPDVLFSTEDAQKWLGRFDPQSVWFSTPSDMLQLCQLMNSIASTKLPSPNDKDGGEKLAKALFKSGPAYRQAQMAELVHKRWDRSDLPWCGALPMQVWLSLSPDALVAVLPAAIARSASSKNLAAVRKELAKLAQSAELGHPDALLASGLIQVDSAGDYDFQYRALAGLLVRDKLLHQVANEAAERWGWACFDAQRRPVVDGVLDAMSLDQLVAASLRVCDGPADRDASAAIVGALEALFMAVGRRIASGAVNNATDVLPLARCVISQIDMASAEWALPVPWSRPTQSADERLQWITACWAWSLLPNDGAREGSWLFPGWCQTLPEAPWWVSTLWFDEKYEPASPTWLRFLKVVDEWLKEFDAPFADAPRALHVALLARAAAGNRLPELTWWASVNECVWAQDALIERLESFGASKASEAALRLWPARLEFERKGSSADKYLVLLMSKVRRWLLGAMNPAAALDLLSEEDIWHLTGVPVSLPPDFRPQLLKKLTPLLLAALEQNPLTIAYGQEEQFFERFGSTIAPLLCDFLSHERLGFAAATCLWRWDGETASQRLKNHQHLEAMVFQHLLMGCPAAYLSVATQALQANPAFFDLPALELWARQKLPNAGTNAPVLLAVLQAAHAAADNQE